jgi:predicted RND superfamily exporter protein
MKFANFITRHVKLVLIIALALTVPAAIGFITTKVNYDILTYLPSDLNSMQGEVLLDKDFKDATISILIVEGMPTKDIEAMESRIAKVPGVSAVLGAADILSPSVPVDVLPSAIREKLFVNDSTLLIVKYDGAAMSEETQGAIAAIRKECGRQCFVSGASVVLKDTKDLVDRETPIYVLLAVVLSVIVLSLTMESFLIPFVFLIEIGLAILYNFGTNFILGQISYITKALAAVLQLGVTMDFSIFLLNRYEEERLKRPDRREAMAHAIKNTFLTISAGALTEIAGFLALCAMSLTLGADIGLVMAKGVLFGLLGTVTILPAMILALDGPIHRFRHKPLLPTFAKSSSFVAKHYKPLGLLFLVLLVPAFYGQTHVKQYYNIIESLPKDLPSIVANEKLKSEYKMTCSHFIVISSSLPRPVKERLVGEIEKVEGINSVLALEKFLGPGIPEEFLPDSIRGVFAQSGHELIIANSSYKAATDESNAQIDALRAIVSAADPAYRMTGEGVLVKDLIKVAAEDFKRVDYVSIGSIFLIILLIFSSLSVPVVMVGSIELSIFINMAVPFFTGETIPFIASIVIGCIQLGVTIDYAILLATRYREELRNGRGRIEAMETAVHTSARSIVTSALTLFAATFGVGLVSKVALLSSLCMMIARGAIISMLIILFVMPAIFVWGEKLIAKTTRNWESAPRIRTAKGKE